jgi:hypothetical protein
MSKQSRKNTLCMSMTLLVLPNSDRDFKEKSMVGRGAFKTRMWRSEKIFWTRTSVIPLSVEYSTTKIEEWCGSLASNRGSFA